MRRAASPTPTGCSGAGRRLSPTSPRRAASTHESVTGSVTPTPCGERDRPARRLLHTARQEARRHGFRFEQLHVELILAALRRREGRRVSTAHLRRRYAALGSTFGDGRDLPLNLPCVASRGGARRSPAPPPPRHGGPRGPPADAPAPLRIPPAARPLQPDPPR